MVTRVTRGHKKLLKKSQENRKSIFRVTAVLPKGSIVKSENGTRRQYLINKVCEKGVISHDEKRTCKQESS